MTGEDPVRDSFELTYYIGVIIRMLVDVPPIEETIQDVSSIDSTELIRLGQLDPVEVGPEEGIVDVPADTNGSDRDYYPTGLELFLTPEGMLDFVSGFANGTGLISNYSAAEDCEETLDLGIISNMYEVYFSAIDLRIF